MDGSINQSENTKQDSEVPVESPKVPKKRINENMQVLKLAQLEKWAYRAHTHISRYHNLFCIQFLTLFNMFVLIDKSKHLDFKNIVGYTNPIDIVLQLFQKDFNLLPYVL